MDKQLLKIHLSFWEKMQIIVFIYYEVSQNRLEIATKTLFRPNIHQFDRKSGLLAALLVLTRNRAGPYANQ
jgi:hypothetical protein